MYMPLRQYVIHNSPDGIAVRLLLTAIARQAAAEEDAGMHADFSPDSVLVDECGRVRLSQREASSPHALFLAADPRPYLAPECIRGEDASPASAVYSLGALCWEMLSGRLPYDIDCLGDDEALAVLGERPADTVPLPPGLDVGLERTLRRALSPVAAERPALTELLAVLNPVKPGPPVQIILGILCLLAAAVCLALAIAWW